MNAELQTTTMVDQLTGSPEGRKNKAERRLWGDSIISIFSNNRYRTLPSCGAEHVMLKWIFSTWHALESPGNLKNKNKNLGHNPIPEASGAIGL